MNERTQRDQMPNRTALVRGLNKSSGILVVLRKNTRFWVDGDEELVTIGAGWVGDCD